MVHFLIKLGNYPRTLALSLPNRRLYVTSLLDVSKDDVENLEPILQKKSSIKAKYIQPKCDTKPSSLPFKYESITGIAQTSYFPFLESNFLQLNEQEVNSESLEGTIYNSQSVNKNIGSLLDINLPLQKLFIKFQKLSASQRALITRDQYSKLFLRIEPTMLYDPDDSRQRSFVRKDANDVSRLILRLKKNIEYFYDGLNQNEYFHLMKFFYGISDFKNTTKIFENEILKSGAKITDIRLWNLYMKCVSGGIIRYWKFNGKYIGGYQPYGVFPPKKKQDYDADEYNAEGYRNPLSIMKQIVGRNECDPTLEIYEGLILALGFQRNVESINSIIQTIWGINVNEVLKSHALNCEPESESEVYSNSHEIPTEGSIMYPRTYTLSCIVNAYSVNNRFTDSLYILDEFTSSYKFNLKNNSFWMTMLRWELLNLPSGTKKNLESRVWPMIVKIYNSPPYGLFKRYHDYLSATKNETKLLQLMETIYSQDKIAENLNKEQKTELIHMFLKRVVNIVSRQKYHPMYNKEIYLKVYNIIEYWKEKEPSLSNDDWYFFMLKQRGLWKDRYTPHWELETQRRQ